MNICVFCGSSSGNNPAYRACAEEVGRILAKRHIGLVYGGGRVGLMGALAEGSLGAGGSVTGVIPRDLVEKEMVHRNLTELLVVESMHSRKLKMSELASGFIALPGGAGTLEELFEQWTWAQLGIHHKPCAMLNVEGYYSPIVQMLRRMVAEGFVEPVHADMLIVEETIEPILDRISAYTPPAPKW
jgi:uncharacterized protein (TIGR00730 family)